MKEQFIIKVMSAHDNCMQCPQSKEIAEFIDQLLGLLFPSFSSKRIESKIELENGFDSIRNTLKDFLQRQGQAEANICNSFFDRLPNVHDMMLNDVLAILAGDPAAQNRDEVIRTYPGFRAIASYRIANLLWELRADNLPRSIMEYAHSRTGIDIHPGAIIGANFCIDHGTGVVIGETAVIGNNVKIYQGVTLGGLSVEKEMANTKRHPTIEDDVVIYSGATILGGNTVIGKGSIVGGNVWLTRSIPARSKVYYKAQLITNGEASGTESVVIKEATA